MKPDGYTVVWESGQDICPDELYELSKPLMQSDLFPEEGAEESYVHELSTCSSIL